MLNKQDADEIIALLDKASNILFHRGQRRLSLKAFKLGTKVANRADLPTSTRKSVIRNIDNWADSEC